MASSLTLEDIAALINSNKKEILDKVEGIVVEVKEVKCQVSDLNEKATKQDIINVEVSKKLDMLEKEISDMKKHTLPTSSSLEVAGASYKRDWRYH